MSPEVVESNPSGPETDLWSLGVVIYQMMVGYTPFLASSPYLSFLRIKRGFLRLPHFLDEATAEIITLLIHKDQKERFRNAAVMTQASPPPPADAGSGESSVNEETGKEIASAPKPSFSYDKLRNLAFFTKDPNFLFPDPFAEDKDAGPGAAVRVPSLSEIALRAVGRACLVVAEKIAANGGSRVGLESWIQVTPSPSLLPHFLRTSLSPNYRIPKDLNCFIISTAVRMLTTLRSIASSGPLLWMLDAFVLNGQRGRFWGSIATLRADMRTPFPLHTSLTHSLASPLPLPLRRTLLLVAHRRGV
jgi:serine/threonine protein kinase